MRKDAVVSFNGVYRFTLSRVWDELGKKILWIMLNPSTADDKIDDPTIVRLINFTKKWGFGGFHVVNFYAFRCTDSKLLLKDPDIDYAGPSNLHYISELGKQVERVIVAPGNCVAKDHYEMVLAHIDPRKLYYLRLTKKGFPQHPLYLKGDLMPKRLFLDVADWNPPPAPAPPDPDPSRFLGTTLPPPPPPRHPGPADCVEKSQEAIDIEYLNKVVTELQGLVTRQAMELSRLLARAGDPVHAHNLGVNPCAVEAGRVEKWNELKEHVQGQKSFGPEDFRRLYDLLILHGQKIEELEIRLKKTEKRVGNIFGDPRPAGDDLGGKVEKLELRIGEMEDVINKVKGQLWKM